MLHIKEYITFPNVTVTLSSCIVWAENRCRFQRIHYISQCDLPCPLVLLRLKTEAVIKEYITFSSVTYLIL